MRETRSRGFEPGGNDGDARPRVVMLVSNGFHPDVRVHHEARSLVGNGYRVEVIAWDRDGAYARTEEVDGIRVVRVRAPSGFSGGLRQLPGFARFWAASVWYLLCGGWDVVHCHDVDTLLPGLLAALIRRRPVIFDAHECYYHLCRKRLPGWLVWFVRHFERFGVARTSMILGACEATSRYYQACSGIPAFTLQNLKIAEEFQFDRRVLQRTRADLAVADGIVLAYFGSFAKNRNLDLLVHAVQNEPRVFLLLAGAGEQLATVLAAVRNAANVRYLGHLPYRDIPLYTAISDCVCFLYDPDSPMAPYNSPNKLYEALAAGIAILGSDIGGDFSRVVRETGCGLLLDTMTVEAIRNAVLRLRDDPVLLPDLKRNSTRAGLTRYHWRSAEGTLLCAYDRLFPRRSLAAEPMSRV